MRWSAANIAVRDHKQQQKKLLLFTNTPETGFVEFVGEMDCKSYHNAVRLDSTPCKQFANRYKKLTNIVGDRKPRGVFEFVLQPVNSDVISEIFKTQHTIMKDHDIYSAKSNKVIQLKNSSIWMKDDEKGAVVRRSTSDIENCEENMARRKRQKINDEIIKPKDVAVCKENNTVYIIDPSTVRKRGRPRVRCALKFVSDPARAVEYNGTDLHLYRKFDRKRRC